MHMLRFSTYIVVGMVAITVLFCAAMPCKAGEVKKYKITYVTGIRAIDVRIEIPGNETGETQLLVPIALMERASYHLKDDRCILANESRR